MTKLATVMKLAEHDQLSESLTFKGRTWIQHELPAAVTLTKHSNGLRTP
jgi:hypothetical protein